MPGPLRTRVALARLRPFRNAYLRRGEGVWLVTRPALAWARIPDSRAGPSPCSPFPWRLWRYVERPPLPWMAERGLLYSAQESALTELFTIQDQLGSVADDFVWVVAGTSSVLGSPERAVRHHQFRREYLGPLRGAQP